jgi:hypothetical protein
VGLAVIKINAGCFTGPSQHCLPVGQATETGGVKAGEGVKRIALEIMALTGGVDKTVIKMCIVPHQDGTLALLWFHGIPHHFEQGLKYIFF